MRGQADRKCLSSHFFSNTKTRTMKKLYLLFLLALIPVLASAQNLKFGYFSYSQVLQSMPDKAIADKNLADLRAKYDAETKRVENEFNAKYEQCLEGQRDFAPTILQKRQAELQELMKKNIAFKAEAQRLLKQAEKDAYAPLRQKILSAVQRIGKERQLAFVINTDRDACPYTDPGLGEDITLLIKDALK